MDELLKKYNDKNNKEYDFMRTMENKEDLEQMVKNDKIVRKKVLDSYQDMIEGKGRDYKEFFIEMENRYAKYVKG